MKIHLLWDFLTGSILQLRSPPAHSDATNPIAQEVAPAGRCRCSTWLLCLVGSRTSRGPVLLDLSLQHGTSVFDAQASPWRCAYLRQRRSGPIDVSVLLA